jgi:hypothetical protein
MILVKKGEKLAWTGSWGSGSLRLPEFLYKQHVKVGSDFC